MFRFVFVFSLTIFIILNLCEYAEPLRNDSKFQIEENSKQQQKTNSSSSKINLPNICSDWVFAPTKQLSQLNPANSSVDAKLKDVLDRVGPDMKPANGFRDYNDISIDVSKRAWQLLGERVRIVSNDKISTLWPHLEQSLIESNVSEKCFRAAESVANGAKSLDNQATQLLNSWGSFPPSGLFEGTLGDIGSYHGCVNIKQNKLFNHAHYCTLAFRPVLPKRKDYDLIISQETRELLELFNTSNSIRSLIEKAQYFHYIYLKLGTCFPIECTPIDVQKFARFLSSRWFLMSGPVKCHSKNSDDYNEIDPNNKKALKLSSRDLNNGIYIWKPHMTQSQLIALTIICFIMLIVIISTAADLLRNRLPAIFKNLSNLSNINHHHYCRSRKQAEPLTYSTTVEGKQMDSIDRGDDNQIDANNNDNNNIQMKCLSESALNFNVIAKPVDERDLIATSKSIFSELIVECSIINNTREFFSISQDQLKNDILCMNGLRCITMSWIIIAHTMQYNDWSAFARIYDVEPHLKSLLNQPLFNASYLVDTFFLISGLLTSYSVFRTKRISNKNNIDISNRTRFEEAMSRFSCSSYLIGRYLRLTPQIFLISLLFILLPLLKSTGGPHWYTMTGEYSENCSNNWWINLLHIQAFYKQEEMCNFVCWWISVDMFYHLFALVVILTIFKYGPRVFIKLCLALSLINFIFQASKHYGMSLPPNMLSTIPQTGAMWSDMTLKFFWTPFAHGFPFLFGFFTGYYLATMRPNKNNGHKSWLTIRRAIIGWILSASSFVFLLYGTYFWVIGELQYSRLVSTCYYIITQFIWSLSLSWIVVACELGFGSFIAEILSCKLFLILGKASYLVYLSHFIILFTFFGSQNLLAEPTQLMITYIVIGNICISMMFGSLLCIVFEMPWLKIQKRIMRNIR